MNRHLPVRALSRALTLSFSSSASSSSSSSFPLKHVTRSNFEPALAELRGHVRAADFVTIDLEMTGVTSAPWRDSFEFDRSDVRYLKVKDSAEKFAVVQFGVCPFRWDSSKNSFVAHPYPLSLSVSLCLRFEFQLESKKVKENVWFFLFNWCLMVLIMVCFDRILVELCFSNCIFWKLILNTKLL